MRFPLLQWTGLLSVTVATFATIAICDHGRWQLGLLAPPRLAAREFTLGLCWGATLIAACLLLVVLSTNVREARGDGFPWRDLVLTFIPAAVHEELLFRGYPFQKLYRWRRGFAIVFASLIFAALHANNDNVTPLGLMNVFLGGVLLSLAYARYERLWFPIGLHLAWNLMTGPILGHEVSGYESLRTVFVERGDGVPWLTGGEFGLEGSVWMTVVEVIAIAMLGLRHRMTGKRSSSASPS